MVARAVPADLMRELQPVIAGVEHRAQARLREVFAPLPPGSPDWLVEFRRDLGWSYVADSIFVTTAEWHPPHLSEVPLVREPLDGVLPGAAALAPAATSRRASPSRR